MTTLKLNFATNISKRDEEDIQQYCQREFGIGLEDKLENVMLDWLVKAREQIREERKVLEEEYTKMATCLSAKELREAAAKEPKMASEIGVAK